MSTEPLLGIGSTFGSYRIEALVGRGGMGVVYRAVDVRLQRTVALKLLSAELGDDESFRERFLRESRLAAATEHPGIVPIYEAGEVDGLLYIAMRYIDGVDLAALLRREGPLEPQRAVGLTGQLADALDAAHARGLIHRDVKPSNALVSGDERVYLVDFGITESASAGDRLTATGQLVGTLDYMAPERIRGEAVDGRCDLYSLGCVLFECLTGEVPFAGPSEVAAIYGHLEEKPPRVSERRPGLPPKLDDVLTRALAKDPADRFQTGAELTAAAQAALPATAAQLRSGLRRQRLLAGAAAILLVGAAVAALVSRSGGHASLRAISENAVGLIDPGSGRIGGQIFVGNNPTALAVGANSIWALNAGDRSISRYDQARKQLWNIAVGDDPAGLAFANGSLWVTDRQDRTVSEINPEAERISRTVPDVANGPSSIAASPGALWVASPVDRTVTRIDLNSGRVAGRTPLPASPTAVATGFGAVWAASEEGGTVFRIDPRTGTVVKAIGVGEAPIAIAVGEGAVWVANRQDGTVSRIDPATDVATTAPAAKEPSAIAAGDGAVWVADSDAGTVTRIDPASRRPPQRIAVGSSPTAIAVTPRSVLAAAVASPASHRGGTLTVETTGYAKNYVDPGNGYTQDIVTLAYDGLITYRRAGGSSYGTLVGDLASSVPEPSADGRTYVFTLRPGIRYSDGEPVRAGDFPAAMESLLRRYGTGYQPYYGQIVGASTCFHPPHRCDLSNGIVADEQSRTVTIRLTKPDPDFEAKLALPVTDLVPAAHPFGGRTAPPGTGPYRIVSFNPSGARLVRNRYFRVWSYDARPDGFPDAIVVRAHKHAAAAVAAVRDGKADMMEVSNIFGTPLLASAVEALAASAPGQLHTTPAPETDYMFMNTRLPPFNDLRVRQAINYAVDEQAIVRAAGGPDVASSTCQILPPGFPGYAPSCRYTADPDSAGTWHAADIERAQRLIAQSGTKGTKVTVSGWEDKRGLLEYIAALLGQLGYHTRLRIYPDFFKYHPWVSQPQIGIMGWSADFGTPSDFALIFRCDEIYPANEGANFGRFCNRRIDDSIDAATATGADTAWPQVFRQIDDFAPIVPLVNRRIVSLVSKRVGNYQAHPLFGPLVDQMWVR